MKFLKKQPNSSILQQKLSYNATKDNSLLRKLLVQEQQGFCAYSEMFFHAMESIHIEHFDGRLKNSETDNYYNWYAVLGWVNLHKPKKIAPYLPILQPSDPTFSDRIKYESGIYYAVNENDTEAKNLIKYLGFNKDELVKQRRYHLERLKFLYENVDKNIEDFKNYLKNHKQELSFITAIEFEFQLDLSDGLV
jgi:hypothetical protein